ncbi:MAG: ATP-binding protein [Thermodesulfobacteriota bacterium]
MPERSNPAPAYAILDTVPSLVLVLDRTRRITFANQALLSFLGATSNAPVLGKRLGEALDCQHARESGCGKAEACSTCGAARAMVAMAHHDMASSEECRISQHDSKHPLDFRVHTAPFPGQDQEHFLLYLTDISHEKRRRALERTFFHDVLNLTSGLVGMSRLLHERQLDAEKQRRFKEALHRQAIRLAAEVEAQRDLAAAENHELTLAPQPCSTRAILEELAAIYSNVAQPPCTVALDPNAQDVTLKTDQRLLYRILGNMTKNAVEASPSSEVRLGCETDQDAVLFWVHNQGFIPRDIQLQIFQRSFSTKGEGRGLGTYCIKLLGERYLRGTVSFESCPETGTVFRFRCPIRLPSADRNTD